MPLFATLFESILTAAVAFFSSYFSFRVAMRVATYSTWLAIWTAFLVAVYVCLSSLYSMSSGLIAGTNGSGISWVAMFFMGLGMFIPANAGAVLSCVASVWIGTGIYKFQRDALQNFGA